MIISLLLQAQATSQSTPYTIYATLGAAVIAAVASLANAYISFKSKDKDFKNDYYKKIIDKRLHTYEKLERIIFQLRREIRIVGDNPNKRYCSFFGSREEFDNFLKLLDSLADNTFWLSVGASDLLVELNDVLRLAYEDCRGRETFDEPKLRGKGVEKFDDINRIKISLAKDLSKELQAIYNVEEFLLTL